MIRTGNDIGLLSGGNVAVMPGYEFGMITGFIALTPNLLNKWALMDVNKSDRQLTLPRGVQIHHLGIRAGLGVQSAATAGVLHLGLIDSTTSNPIAIADTSTYLGEISATLPDEDNQILQGGGLVKQTSLSRSVLFRDARSVNPWANTAFDGINAINSASNFGDLGISSAVLKALPPPMKLEIALRSGNTGNSPLQALGPTVGGLKQRISTPTKDYANKAYFLVDIGYWMRSPEVTTEEDASLNWEKIFQFIR